jgi:flagellar biosynthesis/type III secretory pathway protein FliH
LSPERIELGAAGARLVSVRIVEDEDEDGLSAWAERLRASARAEGAEQARRECAAVLDRAAGRMDTLRGQARGEIARSATELAIGIARALLRVELAAGNYDLERIVRDALAAAATDRADCVVHLHPVDADAIRGVPFRSGTRIEPDLGVARGDVHVETELGLMVREVDEAVSRIASALSEAAE